MDDFEEPISVEQELLPEADTPEIMSPIDIIKFLPGILIELAHNEPIQRLEAVRRLRKILSAKGYTPIQEVIDSGIIPLLLKYCTYDTDPELQVVYILT